MHLNGEKNFIWSTLRKGERKFYINNPGHMVKMATMAINIKNLYNLSSPEPAGL